MWIAAGTPVIETRVNELSTARCCAQTAQKIREAMCEHPESAIRLLREEGYVEYCVNCNKVTDLYEP